MLCFYRAWLFAPIVVSCAICFYSCASTNETQFKAYSNSLRSVHGTPTCIFISDTQAPLWIEKFWLQYDNNEEATDKILNTIAADTSCSAVFHLGDITGLGSFSSYWHDFDEKESVLKDTGIPLFPAFGNHEYMPFNISGARHFFTRFPFTGESWYYKQVGEIAVILLNSNFSNLSDDEIIRQQQWFVQTLEQLDNESTVSGVLVGCHHPPYTNSTRVDSSEEVQKQFVKPFIKSKKGILFLTGHSHASEHFKVENKDFLVLGGAGGLLHPLRRGDKANREDLIPHDDDRSFFHYVRIVPRQNMITVEIQKLDSTRTGFELYNSFDIQYKR